MFDIVSSNQTSDEVLSSKLLLKEPQTRMLDCCCSQAVQMPNCLISSDFFSLYSCYYMSYCRCYILFVGVGYALSVLLLYVSTRFMRSALMASS